MLPCMCAMKLRQLWLVNALCYRVATKKLSQQLSNDDGNVLFLDNLITRNLPCQDWQDESWQDKFLVMTSCLQKEPSSLVNTGATEKSLHSQQLSNYVLYT